MKKIDILRKMFEEQKVVRTSDLKKLNIDRKFLEIALSEGTCKKVCRGVYISNDEFDSEFISQLKFENSVYALQSALIIHEYTNLNYCKKAFFVEKKIDNNEFILLKDDITVGVIEVENEMGNIVRVTDLERTMVDLVRYNKYIDADVYSKVFKKYMTSAERDLNKIIDYAMQLGCLKEVSPIFEVFYGW